MRSVKLQTLGVGVVFLVALPWLLDSEFLIGFAVLVLYSATLGQSWNILGGYAGQFSFGSVLFFGTGAYTSSILHVTYGINPWIGLLVGVVMGMAVGAFVGFLSFRFGLRGSYFALITLAFAEAFRILANTVEFTGAGIGIYIPLRQEPANFQFTSQMGFYYVILAFFLISTYITLRLEHTRFGARLMAIRENEDAAEALGVNTFRHKMLAIMISGGIGAAGGTFYAQYYLYIDPYIAYGVEKSVEMLLVSIIGGMGTVFGPLVGAFALHSINEIARHYLEAPGMSLVVYGVILVLIIGFLPDGLIGLLKSKKKADDDA
jgi:branched-chain amino acid transport system permease protein